ncbi:MAG TPA: LysR family transcriptional regulator [Xanthobacteraceae bacterium]|nr:LysR family transcriptional regulator [Xanthobacteraceae bacterium]
MDRLEAMSVLVAAAETGSLSAAGRKLGMPLPTVSRKVSELEVHLKTRLLIRSTRRLTLTDAGAAYVSECKRILEQVSEAERAASGEYSLPRGDVVITAPVVFGRLHVLPVVEAFLDAFPEINARLALSDRNVDLIDDHVDVAVRIGVLSDSGMVATKVGSVRRVVCASADYLSRYGVPKTPDDVAEWPCVGFDGLTSSMAWRFMVNGVERAIAVKSRLSVNTVEAALDAAIAGIGMARVLSYQAAPAVAEGKLRIVLQDHELEPLPINLIHVGQGTLPRKTRAFLDYATPRLRDRAMKASLSHEQSPKTRSGIGARNVRRSR